MVDTAVIGKGARGRERAWPVFGNEAATLWSGRPEETGGKYEATVHASCLVEWLMMHEKKGLELQAVEPLDMMISSGDSPTPLHPNFLAKLACRMRLRLGPHAQVHHNFAVHSALWALQVK